MQNLPWHSQDGDEWATIINWWPLQKWWHISRFYLSCQLLPYFYALKISYKTSSFKWARTASHYTVDQLPGHRSAQGKSHCVAYITQRGIPSRKTYVCSLNDKDNFSPGFYISSLHLPLYVKVRWRNLLFTCALCSSLAAEKVSEKLFYFNWLFSKQQEKGQCKQRLYRRNKWKINILK